MIWLHFDKGFGIDGQAVDWYPLADGQAVDVVHWYPLGSTRIAYRDGKLAAPHCTVTGWGDRYCIGWAQDSVWDVVAQEIIVHSGMQYVVTVVCENGYRVWIDSENSSQCFAVPPAQTARVQYDPALAAAGIQLDVGDNRYWLVVSLLDGTVLYRGHADELTMQGHLHVICTVADMKGHSIEDSWGYVNGNWCRYEHMVISTDEHVYIPKLIPWLWLEALAVEAWDEARSYLCGELLADWQELLQYVGTVCRVCTPPFGTYLPDAVGYVDDKGMGKVLLCTMQGDKIADVQRLDC